MPVLDKGLDPLFWRAQGATTLYKGYEGLRRSPV